jgi:hypothetical protein
MRAATSFAAPYAAAWLLMLLLPQRPTARGR